jgi:hypothetical protein
MWPKIDNHTLFFRVNSFWEYFFIFFIFKVINFNIFVTDLIFISFYIKIQIT